MLDFNRKRKYITTEHSTSNRRRNSIVFKLIDRFIFRGFDKIVSISEATEKSLKEWIGGEMTKKLLCNSKWSRFKPF